MLIDKLKKFINKLKRKKLLEVIANIPASQTITWSGAILDYYRSDYNFLELSYLNNIYDTGLNSYGQVIQGFYSQEYIKRKHRRNIHTKHINFIFTGYLYNSFQVDKVTNDFIQIYFADKHPSMQNFNYHGVFAKKGTNSKELFSGTYPLLKNKKILIKYLIEKIKN